MEDGAFQKHSKYFFIVCFLIIAIVSLYLLKPFVTTIISAILLAYIFYPLYLKIKQGVRSENVASLITVIIIVFIIIIPLIFAANALINQSIDFFYRVRELDVGQIETFVAKYVSANVDIQDQFKELLNRLTLSLAKETSDFVIALPGKVLQFFAMLFIMFYLFKDGQNVVEQIQDHIPLREVHKRHITKKFSSVIYASLYGLVMTAFIQGTAGAIGLWIFNVPSPLLWGLVMIILSMLPFVGASFVWFPAAIYKLFTGETFNGIGLILYGLFIVSTIDNIIRPKLIGSKGKIHPVMVLLGVLGGIRVFGLLGIILGPLIFAIFNVFLDIYILERDT